jgi:conjugal transfer pilus assembly protein TraF
MSVIMIKRYSVLLLALCLLCVMTEAYAESFLDDKARGWHWYETNAEEKEKKSHSTKPKSKVSPKPVNIEGSTPTERVKNLREQVQQRLNAAIDDPTEENIKNYIVVQNLLMNKSEKFASGWQRVIYTNPEYDSTLKNPVNQAARNIYLAEQSKLKKANLKALSQEYGLFYFFKGSCPYCHKFAPLVKSFAEEYGWDILPISMDGGKIADFPDARMDNGIASKLNITTVPALIAIHPKTKKMIPLAYGMVSFKGMEDRALLLMEGENENENNNNNNNK